LHHPKNGEKLESSHVRHALGVGLSIAPQNLIEMGSDPCGKRSAGDVQQVEKWDIPTSRKKNGEGYQLVLGCPRKLVNG